MMSTALKVAGVLALFLWTAGGFVAWLLVQDRVQVVFQEAASANSHGPSEMAVLREDLAELRNDLQALTAATRTGFQTIGMAHGSRKVGDDGSRTLGDDGSRTVDDSTRQDATKKAKAVPPAAKPAQKRGFLAFKLPERSFRFDKLQRFEIIPSLSRVGFDGKSTLHDFSGVTSKVRGQVTACLAHPDVDCSAWGEVDARALSTGHDGRDQEMFEHLSTEKHPKITFRIQGFDAKKVDSKAMVVEGTAVGHMTIRGVTHSHQMTVKLSLDTSRRLLIEGEGKVNLTDYKIPIPTALGLVRMYDEVKIWIAVRARCLGPVAKATDKHSTKHLSKEKQHDTH